MIYTVTFNPAIDYVVRLDRELQVGDVNRARGEDCVLGGKGINVSGVLAQLGCESVALGFVAGETGAWLERGLAAQGLKTDFVHLDHGMTRINVKIKAGQETELNGAGPDIPEAAMQALEQSSTPCKRMTSWCWRAAFRPAWPRRPMSGCWPGWRAAASAPWSMPRAICS